MSVWHFGGWLQAHRMGRLGTRAAEAAVQETFARVLQRLPVRQPVLLKESLRVAVPAVVGWLRPVILLPVGAVTGLTPQQLEAILAHELAHIRRWDCLVQALQAVTETLLFYHPAVWWVSRRIRQESEHCCDDLAVGVCGDRRGYAHALAKVAELGAAGWRRSLGKPAFAPAATGGKVLPRIRRILGLQADCCRYGRPYVAAVVALGILLAVGVFCVCCSGDSYASAGPADMPAPRQATLPVRTEASAPGAAPGGTDDRKWLLPILHSLKQDVVELGKSYPQLAKANAVEVTADGWLFEQDCRDMGKRQYQNTGPFPVAIGLRVMTEAQFRAQAAKVEMRLPSYRWDYLGLVGWTTLHTGPDIPGALVGDLQDALRRPLAKIGPLNRQALAARLPRTIQEERERLLADADAAIRKGVRGLADQYPLLRKGQLWHRLEPPSDPGRIGIHLRRQQGGKGGTDAQEFPPSEAFSILVVIKPPPDEIEQLVLRPFYQHLGLVGQVSVQAADPQLDAALRKLVSDALAPLSELERRASALPSPPATQPAADPMAPAPAKLEGWLAGKEVVEVCFAGPHMEPLKLRDSLKIKVPDNDWDFRLTAGQGGGANRSFVEICMKVSPENTRRLLALQEELEPRGYRLDPEHTHVWSLDGDPNARAKAREMAPELLAAAADGIRKALPKAQTEPERPRGAMYVAGISYEVPGTDTRGMIWISEITAMKRWHLPVGPEVMIHLPRLGLMVATYYRPGRNTMRDASPERWAIRKAVDEAIGPLLKLEGDTARRHEWPPPPAARPGPAPATQPAGIEGNPRIRRDGNVITLAQDATDADFAALRDVKGIVELRMGGGPVGAAGPYITDAGLANLSGWTDLKVLYLPGLPVHDRRRYPNVRHFTDAGLVHLRGLTKLEKLVLVDQEITDEGLANLSGLTELRELWLDFIPLGDAGLEHLSNLRKLQVLRFYGAGITDKGLRHLAGMADMRNLQLGRAGVTDKGLAAVIGRMHKLETLDLQGNPISDDGLSALGNLTDLQWLALSNTPITDVGLKQVAKLHRLQYLLLDCTDITDAGLRELAGIKQLKRLKVEKTSVTAEGIRKLKLSLPGVEAVLDAQGGDPRR